MIKLRTFGLAVVLSLVAEMDGVPAAASVGSVNNFRMVSITGQNVSFSWEVNNIPIGNISYFEIYHHTKVMEHFYTGRGTVRFQVNETTNSTNGQKLTFAHIVYVRRFGYLLQKIMHLRVILSNGNMLESEQIYAETLDVTAVTIELRVKLSDARCCFQQTANISRAYFIDAILRAILAYCQCTAQSIRYLYLYGEYFSCSMASSGYATFRSYIQTQYFDPAKRSIAVEAIRRWLQDPSGNTVLIRGIKYSVKAGSCGLTVSHLNAPFCNGTSIETALSQVANETAVIVLSVSTATLFVISLCLAVILITCFIKQSPRCCGKRAK